MEQTRKQTSVVATAAACPFSSRAGLEGLNEKNVVKHLEPHQPQEEKKYGAGFSGKIALHGEDDGCHVSRRIREPGAESSVPRQEGSLTACGPIHTDHTSQGPPRSWHIGACNSPLGLSFSFFNLELFTTTFPGGGAGLIMWVLCGWSALKL